MQMTMLYMIYIHIDIKRDGASTVQRGRGTKREAVCELVRCTLYKSQRLIEYANQGVVILGQGSAKAVVASSSSSGGLVAGGTKRALSPIQEHQHNTPYRYLQSNGRPPDSHHI